MPKHEVDIYYHMRCSVNEWCVTEGSYVLQRRASCNWGWGHDVVVTVFSNWHWRRIALRPCVLKHKAVPLSHAPCVWWLCYCVRWVVYVKGGLFVACIVYRVFQNNVAKFNGAFYITKVVEMFTWSYFRIRILLESDRLLMRRPPSALILPAIHPERPPLVTLFVEITVPNAYSYSKVNDPFFIRHYNMNRYTPAGPIDTQRGTGSDLEAQVIHQQHHPQHLHSIPR
jgi:hypothetical protein